MQILTCASVQAGLDKMAQGHMLADVVAIIGENRVVFIVRKAEAVIKFHLSASFLSVFSPQELRTSCSGRLTVNAADEHLCVLLSVGSGRPPNHTCIILKST